MSRKHLTLLQLPVPQPSAFAATGNVPLAAGCLAVAARAHGLRDRLEAEVIDPSVTDRLGDTQLAHHIAKDEPDFLGLSLYLWNSERSLHIAREVKRLSPKTRVVVGGPEINPDNPYVMGLPGFDIAVTGEAEDLFATLMTRLVAGEDVSDLPGIAVRDGDHVRAFNKAPTVNFPLTNYPSPYLEGAIEVDGARSTYLETVRGCRSHCTYCFYPKSSNSLRSLDAQQSAALVAALVERGARDLVFLDPTFNHRPDFDELLEALADANQGRAGGFAEVRAEGLQQRHAEGLRRAGFTRLEIGLQSVNLETLKRIKRFGTPAKVAGAAAMLRDQGIGLLVDLIMGLPGDTPDDVRRGVDFLLEHGLAADAQVFPLALLPGTAMRATAEADGVVYDPAPPYRVLSTPKFDQDVLRDLLFDVEDRLGRVLDEFPRPHLVDAEASSDDVFTVDLDTLDIEAINRATRPGAQHVALWLQGRDIFGQRQQLSRVVRERLRVDPYATVDLVLEPRAPFELDLLGYVRVLLNGGAPSYLSRSQALRGEDVQRRITVVLPATLQAPDWVASLRTLVPVFRDQSLTQASQDAELLGVSLPGARIVSAEVDEQSWRRLVDYADPEAVTFANRQLERRWVERVLGYSEIDRG